MSVFPDIWVCVSTNPDVPRFDVAVPRLGLTSVSAYRDEDAFRRMRSMTRHQAGPEETGGMDRSPKIGYITDSNSRHPPPAQTHASAFQGSHCPPALL